MSARKVHALSQRLYVNAGLRFPLCAENASALDLRRSSWATSADFADWTCKHCRNAVRRIVRGEGRQ